MSAQPEETPSTRDESLLKLVPTIEHFDRASLSEGAMAVRISILSTYASEHYRDYLAGKSGIDWEVERRNTRRVLAARIFQEFGMLAGAVKTDDEISASFAASKAAAAKAKNIAEANEKGPKATDGLTGVGRNFVQTFYDPAEREAAAMAKADVFELIESRFRHPVVRTTNSWVMLSGKSNEHMREDAVMLQRAAAILLENIDEAEYKEDLEL
jgi:hypothetical protein